MITERVCGAYAHAHAHVYINARTLISRAHVFVCMHARSIGLLSGVTGLTLEDLRLSPTRDCLDIVGTSDVWIRNVHCAGGGDDALVFKSDFSTGAALPVHNVTVRCPSICDPIFRSRMSLC